MMKYLLILLLGVPNLLGAGRVTITNLQEVTTFSTNDAVLMFSGGTTKRLQMGALTSYLNTNNFTNLTIINITNASVTTNFVILTNVYNITNTERLTNVTFTTNVWNSTNTFQVTNHLYDVSLTNIHDLTVLSNLYVMDSFSSVRLYVSSLGVTNPIAVTSGGTGTNWFGTNTLLVGYGTNVIAINLGTNFFIQNGTLYLTNVAASGNSATNSPVDGYILMATGADSRWVDPATMGFGSGEVGASILSQPQSLTRKTNTTAVFSLTALGTAPLYYKWYTNDVESADGGVITSGAFSNIISLASFPISWNATEFYCLVTNAYGFVTSSIVTLTVTNGVTENPGSCGETPDILLANNGSLTSIYLNDAANAAFMGLVWPANQPATNLCKLDFNLLPAGTITGLYWTARVYNMDNGTNLNTNSIVATSTPIPGASIVEGYNSFLFPSPAVQSVNTAYGWVVYESDASGNPVTSVNGVGWVRLQYDNLGVSQTICSTANWPLSGVNQYGLNDAADLDVKAYFMKP
jgi:hypothetical protein